MDPVLSALNAKLSGGKMRRGGGSIGAESKQRRRERNKLRKTLQSVKKTTGLDRHRDEDAERTDRLVESNVKRLKALADKDRSREKAIEVLGKLVLAKQKQAGGKTKKKRLTEEMDDIGISHFSSSKQKKEMPDDVEDDLADFDFGDL